MQLTTSQQELALSCFYLARNEANKVRIAAGSDWHDLRDEAFSVALFALCRAALKFNPDLGFAFTTYATKAIRTSLWEWTSEIMEKNNSEFNGSVCESGDITNLTDVEELLFDEKPEPLQVLLEKEKHKADKQLVKKVKRLFTPREKYIIDEHHRGRSQKELSREMQLSRTTLSKTYMGAIRKAKKVFNK